MTKICGNCKKEKLFNEFYKDKNRTDNSTYLCKDCTKEKVKEWRKTNPKKKLIGDRRRRKNNKEKIIQQQHDWYEINKEKVKKAAKESYVRNREKRIKAAAEWKKANPEKHRLMAIKGAVKKRSTPKGKLNNNISRGIYGSLLGNKNGCSWESLVGYSLDNLKKHLEKQFQHGMTWDNYGEWHLDHKIPISVFNFEKPGDNDFKKCWALKNLQPLWAKDNLEKWNKLDKPFQPSLIF